MDKFRIAVLVGSLRKDSFNRRLAHALRRMAPEDVVLTELRIDDLPPYNQDDDAHQADSVRRLKTEVAASQGVLFVTPEYNRSIPGVLKNAIDHASRPYGQSAWARHPAGVIRVSIGAARPGTVVNLEVDVLARYVARLLEVGRAGDSSSSEPSPDSRLLERLRASGYV